MRHHPLKPDARTSRSAFISEHESKMLTRIHWPSFTGVATLVGTSTDNRTTVYYDATLGNKALANAQGLIVAAPGINSMADSIFGTNLGPVNVIVFALGGMTDGTGGADHMGCDVVTGGNIEVDAAFGQNNRVSALYMAEYSEDYMKGNLCGVSTGEALSRWCANTAEPGALSDFYSAPVWQQDGSPNWVDTTENTDGNYDSIGCGMAFISWLIHVVGIPFYKIAQELVALGAAGTWTKVYVKLTGQSVSPWSKFMMATNAINIINDDPFAGAPGPVPPPPPPTPPIPPPVPAPTTLTSGTYLLPGGATLIIP